MDLSTKLVLSPDFNRLKPLPALVKEGSQEHQEREDAGGLSGLAAVVIVGLRAATLTALVAIKLTAVVAGGGTPTAVAGACIEEASKLVLTCVIKTIVITDTACVATAGEQLTQG